MAEPASPAAQPTDVIVVGAGVIGCSIAYAMARAGHRVAVVDRAGSAGQGSTAASSAIIRFNYSTMIGVATSWEAHFAWLGWEDFLGGRDTDGGLAKFHRTGQIVLDAPGQSADVVLGLFDQVAIPYRRLTPQQLRAEFAWLDPASHCPPKPLTDDAFWADPSGEIGGYLVPDAGFVDDPGYAARNLATAARRAGADFVFRAQVVEVLREAGRVAGVRLADGRQLRAPVVVNVAGPESNKLNEIAGVEADFGVRARPMRVEVHSVPVPAGFDQPPPADGSAPVTPGPILTDLDLGTYFRGTLSGELNIGGTEPACDPQEWLADGVEFNHNVTRALYETQVYRVARRIPELTVPNQPKGIAAAYDVSDDWLPIYDRTELPGYYVAIGTSGNQFKNAPVVGDYLRALIEACEQGHDHDRDPVRYRLPITGYEVDLSHYSRLRRPNEQSSNTVLG